jgi:hypothetical protein
VTISKEAFDDYQRYKRDKEANSQLYQRMNVTGLQSISSLSIKVGDMILIRKNQRVSIQCYLRDEWTDLGSSYRYRQIWCSFEQQSQGVDALYARINWMVKPTGSFDWLYRRYNDWNRMMICIMLEDISMVRLVYK